MRRWLVAVLALHFFLSVGAFAFDKLPIPEPFGGATHGLVGERAAAPTSPAPEIPKPGQMADRGLTDPQTELPEGLGVPIATSSRADALRTPPPPLARDLTPPVLDGPQRPPPGSPAVA